MSEIGKSSPDPTCLVMIMFCTVSTVACIFCMFQIYLHVHWCWAANITGSFGSICKEFLRRLRSLIFCQHDIGNICPPCPGSRSCQDQTWNDQMEPVTSTTSTTSVYDILGTSQKSLPPWFPPSIATSYPLPPEQILHLFSFQTQRSHGLPGRGRLRNKKYRMNCG